MPENEMKTQSIDTQESVEKELIFLQKNASPARKLSLVRSFSQTTIQLARRAIVRKNPHLSEKQIDVLYIAVHYGADLAQRVEKYLDGNHARS